MLTQLPLATEQPCWHQLVQRSFPDPAPLQGDAGHLLPCLVDQHWLDDLLDLALPVQLSAAPACATE